MKIQDQTSFVFREFNCAQTIFSLFAPDLGLDRTSALKIAAGFGGGMNCGETCGAVTGAYMVIGLKAGHSTPDPGAKAKTRDHILTFNRLFLRHHSSLKCRELLGCDISDPAQRQHASETGLFSTLCPQFLYTAAKILEENY